MGKKDKLYEKAFNRLKEKIQKEKIRGKNVLKALVETLHQESDTGLPHFWWCGVYLLMKSVSGQRELTLFAGSSTACSPLPVEPRIGGVCSDCVLIEKPVIVPDVTRYMGHITCDARALSEIAVPLFNDEGRLVGVLDADDVKPNSFGWDDAAWLSRIADLCTPHL